LGTLDCIFSVEPKDQLPFVKRLLDNKRKVYDIPHTINAPLVNRIGKKFKEQREQNDPKNIAVNYHAYEHPILIPLVSLSDLRLNGVNKYLCGFPYICRTCRGQNQCPDKKPGDFKCDKFQPIFDGFSGGLTKKKYAEHLSELSPLTNVGYESYTLSSIGRWGVEMATMGIPCFIPENCRSHKLYEKFYGPVYCKDFKKIGDKIHNILRDKIYRENMVQEAYNNVLDEYDFPVVKEKIMSAVEESK